MGVKVFRLLKKVILTKRTRKIIYAKVLKIIIKAHKQFKKACRRLIKIAVLKV